MLFEAVDESKMREMGSSLGRLLRDGDVVALNGGLGAGKTRFAQGVGRGLGIQQELTSPTFNLVFEYDSPALKLFHFDLYRLDDPSQLEDIDFYGMVDDSTDGACLIEWSSLFPDEMPDDRLDIDISVSEDGSRELDVSAKGARASALLEEWAGSLEGVSDA